MSGVGLHDRLIGLKRRIVAVGAGAGVAWGVAGGVVILLVCMWLDLLVELGSGVRAGCGWLALVGGMGLMGMLVVRCVGGTKPQAVARRLDEAVGGRGQVVSGVDLMLGTAGSRQKAEGGESLTAGLARMAVERAEGLVRGAKPQAVAPAGPLWRACAGVGGVVVVICVVWGFAPRLVGTQFARFFDPWGDHPPYSRLVIEVEPGDAEVVYGRGIDIRATIEGGVSERVVLVLRTVGSRQKAVGSAEELLPMFPEEGGRWRASVMNVTEPVEYLVRAGSGRSRQHRLGVITVPNLEEVTFRVTPPGYTHRPAYEGPLPQGGLAGLPGTVVEVRAKSNRPLSGGTMRFAPLRGNDDERRAPRSEFRMMNDETMIVGHSPEEAMGSFVIEEQGRVEIRVSDVDGQESNDVVVAPVIVLADERPFVRLVEPKPNSFATPDVTLNVTALAEDDYGVSRVQVYRALNESRARATELEVPDPARARTVGVMPLPLGDFGLRPGDVVKLYARVEDTDPAGPKGSESPVVTVQIISQEELQRLLLAREGMEVLESKYAQALRRLEAMDAELAELERMLEDLAQMEGMEETPDFAALRRGVEERMAELAERMRLEAEEVAALGKPEAALPFDLDEALSKHLEEVARAMREAGEGLEGMVAQRGEEGIAGFAAMRRGVGEIREGLGVRRSEFEREVMEPLEHFAAVFPLIEAEARYVELYERQRDLEERMSSLQGQRGDDPSVRVRMRDLEEEQGQLRQELRELLDDIETHAERLPEREEFEELRATAVAFAQAVRASEASPEMSRAEMSLSEFAGTRAWTSSREAADILESFLGQCEGMGQEGEAGMCLRFQPTLASGLGNTVEQMLSAMGMGAGMMGTGSGSGGYSMRRQTLQNVGIYGSLPMRSMASSGEGGSADRGFGADGRGVGDQSAEADAMGAWGELQAAGEGAAVVPVSYRRRVGEYFRRVAEELE